MEKGGKCSKQTTRLFKGGSTNRQLIVLKHAAYMKKTCKRLSEKTAGYFTDIGSWKTIKLLSFISSQQAGLAHKLSCSVMSGKNISI